MRAGQMRNQVTYQEPVSNGLSADGQDEDTWPDVATWPASIGAASGVTSGREVTNSLQQQAQVSLVIGLRWPGYDLKPTGRFVMGSRIFNIAWIDNVDGRNRELRAYCVETSNES